MLISLNNLTFGYDDVTVLEDVDVTVNENDRIGLVGVNGSGKSTLIKLMLGFLHADEGEVLKKSELSVGYLPQNAAMDSELTVENEAYSVFSEVLEAGDRMEVLANEMAALPHDGTEYRIKSAEYEKVSDFFRAKDGYLVTTKVKTVLNGMGFSGKYDQVVSTLSGGEKTRLALSKLLLKNPELLVLDEPTNHLDYDTLEWLEKYLSESKGAILVVSHDRRFLDKTVNVIWDLTEKTVSSYRGNYTKFKQLKAERYERWQKEYKI
ncbi:aBC transporter ATP-binding protein [Faecalibacterium sp. CAG:1138]|nr:aBC transporter ATP-binding protein [Faecalibacterium sp. CAG:1138]